MNHFFQSIEHMSILLAASKPIGTLVLAGVATVAVISLFTFSNWRRGVKIAFVMLLFEGAIRKWVVPGAQELAYFMKDMFLIGAYLRFFFSPDLDIRSWKVKAPAGLILLCCVVLSFSAINPNIGSVGLGLYGIKIYVFYIPLAFMIPHLFRSQEDMMNNLFWYAMLATPICLLGVVQYAAPGFSTLNVMSSGEAGTSMGWEDARIRISGTFSYITGFTTFVSVFFTLHLALLMTQMPKWRWWLLAANMPLIFGNALMSGSRGAVFMMVATAIAFVGIALVHRMDTSGNKTLVMVGIMGVTALVVGAFFTTAKQQWTVRLSSADDSVVYRVVGMPVIAVGYALKTGGVFGLGIGMTHPAVERLRNVMNIPKPRVTVPTYDTEIAQVLVELGLLGWMAWYAMRFMMLLQSWVLFLRAPPGPLKPILLTSFMIQAPHMLFSVMLNHTANFLVFACYGLSLIATLQPAVTRKAVLRDTNGRNRVPPALPGAPPQTLPPLRGSKYGPTAGQRLQG